MPSSNPPPKPNSSFVDASTRLVNARTRRDKIKAKQDKSDHKFWCKVYLAAIYNDRSFDAQAMADKALELKRNLRDG